MMREFVSDHLFMCSILAFGFLSLLMQGSMTLFLKGYVKASANMKTTKKKLLLHLKNQFETIYGMEYEIRNMDAYVDKYLLKLRFLGISYSGWERIPFLSAGVVTLLAAGELFYGYRNGQTELYQMEIVFSYIIVLACFFLFFHIFGIKNRKQQIHIQLVDYLENYLANRLSRNREERIPMEDMEKPAPKEKPVYAATTETAQGDESEEVASGGEDMDMLKRLILEAEQGPDKEIAADREERPEENSDIALLEEFVQSFLG